MRHSYAHRGAKVARNPTMKRNARKQQPPRKARDIRSIWPRRDPFGRWNRMNSEEPLPGLWLVNSISRLVPRVWPDSSALEALELSRADGDRVPSKQWENKTKRTLKTTEKNTKWTLKTISRDKSYGEISDFCVCSECLRGHSRYKTPSPATCSPCRDSFETVGTLSRLFPR